MFPVDDKNICRRTNRPPSRKSPRVKVQTKTDQKVQCKGGLKLILLTNCMAAKFQINRIDGQTFDHVLRAGVPLAHCWEEARPYTASYSSLLIGLNRQSSFGSFAILSPPRNTQWPAVGPVTFTVTQGTFLWEKIMWPNRQNWPTPPSSFIAPTFWNWAR